MPSKHIRWCFVLLALFTGVCISCAFLAFEEQGNPKMQFKDRIANTVKAADHRKTGTTQFDKLKQPAMVPLSKTASPALSARLLLPGARIEGQDAVFTLGEYFSTQTRSRWMKGAYEADGTSVPYSNSNIWPTIPDKVQSATRQMGLNEPNKRIDVLYNKQQIDLLFHSRTGKVTGVGSATAKYGNAIIVNGRETSTNRNAMGVLSLVDSDPDGVLKVIATSGGSSDNGKINSSFGDKFYGRFEYISMRDHKFLNLGFFQDNTAGATGNTRKQDFLNQWGLNRVQPVQLGDIIKVENVEGKISYAKDSQVHTLSEAEYPNIKKAVFFQITKQGFKPMKVNQLETRVVDVPQNATDAELDATFPKALGIKYNIVAKRFRTRPDVSKPGKTKAFVRTFEVLEEDRVADFDYEVELNVIPAGDIKARDGHFVLGEQWRAKNLKRMFVSANQLDGTPVAWVDDQIELVLPQAIKDKLNANNRRIDVLFQKLPAPFLFNSNTGHIQSTQTATATYGNAIVIRGQGDEAGQSRDAGGAYGLLNDDGLKVIATSGASNDNDPLNDQFKGKPFAAIAHVDMKQATTKNLSKESLNWFNGDAKKQDFLNAWGNNRELPVEPGDVIIVANEAGKISYTQDSKEQSLAAINRPKELYFEITDKGYRPLQVNQLKPQSVNIPVHATQDEMDLRLSEFFKLPSKAKLTIKRYESNPDVGKVDKASAKVVVSEKLMSGKEVEATYDVPVQVVKRATFATRPITFNLGETVTMEKLGAMLASAKEYDDRDIKWGDQKLSINRPQAIDKLLNPKNQRLTKIGNPIDVTMRFDASTGSVLSTNTMKVGYGHAIAIKGYEMTPRTAGGVMALVKEQNQWQIVATDGLDADNHAVHNRFPKEQYLNVALYASGGAMLTIYDQKQLAAEMTATGDTPKQQLLDQWGKNRIAPTNPGDVLAVEHAENKVSWMQDGVAQNMPKRLNKKEWLFEVTDKGYRLLDLNQMVFSALTFENHTDPSKVEQVVRNEVAKQQTSVKVESIDMPDLKTVGKKKIKLKVSQASVAKNNQRIAYVYEIPIEVTEGSLSFVQMPKVIDFGSVRIDGKRIEVPRVGDQSTMTIKVRDGRSRKTSWTLDVQQQSPLTDSKQRTVKQSLLFFREDAHEYPLKVGTNQRIKKVSNAQIDHSFTYDPQAGLLLRIPENMFDFSADTYDFKLQWTLGDTPV